VYSMSAARSGAGGGNGKKGQSDTTIFVML